ncbi:HAMP domain-containing methyl-accepting chemotaxis protein [Nisaea sp.]|uniref:methyl-accepting chemotaxis protein n=1 Tax=Nisaea sp. TaxID=2024842 RepID=UPI0032638108
MSADVRQTLLETRERLGAYLIDFDGIVELQKAESTLVRGAFDSLGTDMRKKTSIIMSTAFRDGDSVAASMAGHVMEHLMFMRMTATELVLLRNQKSYDDALKQNAAMVEDLEKLLQRLENSEQIKLVEEVNAMSVDFTDVLRQLMEIITKRKHIVDEVLERIGSRVETDMEALKGTIKAEQDTLGPSTASAMERAIAMTGAISLVSILLGTLFALMIGKGISNPIRSITRSMARLADGDKSVEIPGADHKDEIGAMAKAVHVFKENMIKAEELAAEQDTQRRNREERAVAIETMTQDFDQSVTGLLEAVSNAAKEMEGTSISVSSIADTTNSKAVTVTASAEQASANVQAVATATEELSTSIKEISWQVSQTSDVAIRAVEQADDTDRQINNLAEAAKKIGDVVDLIAAIAEQTNLLALNATIEAARAGESGRGFAVVAGEVKNLASQTAKATEDIATQIGAVQAETSTAVAAIQGIRQTIGEISEIASGVAASIEEQGAATSEIAKNVEEAAKGAEEVSTTIVDVKTAAGDAGGAAVHVTGLARDLNGKADLLRGEVERFLSGVRTA